MVSPPPWGVPVWGAWGCPHPGGSREDSLRKRRGGAELVLQDAGRHNLRRGHGSHALQSLILRDLVLRGKGGTGGNRGYRGTLSSLNPSVPDRICKASSQSHSSAEGPVQRDPPAPSPMLINIRSLPISSGQKLMGLGNVPLPLLVALPPWRCEGFLAPLLKRAKCNGEQKEFQIQAQLTKFMACPQKKGKKS